MATNRNQTQVAAPPRGALLADTMRVEGLGGEGEGEGEVRVRVRVRVQTIYSMHVDGKC